MERDIYLAAKELQYELEFEDANREDRHFEGLYQGKVFWTARC